MRRPCFSQRQRSGAGLRSVRAARDGYVYGDHVPDYIFLLMESQNDFGGESFFVECEQIPSRFCDQNLQGGCPQR